MLHESGTGPDWLTGDALVIVNGPLKPEVLRPTGGERDVGIGPVAFKHQEFAESDLPRSH
jgi:hypothetical protein